MALRWHITDDVTRDQFTTLCGKKGIPTVSGDVFIDHDGIFQGRIPGSAGNGVQAIRKSAVTVNDFGKICSHCFKRFCNS